MNYDNQHVLPFQPNARMSHMIGTARSETRAIDDFERNLFARE